MKLKDIMDPYIPFTLLCLPMVAMAMFRAPNYNWVYGVWFMSTIFIGLWGLHSWDIMKGGYKNTPKSTLNMVGYVCVTIGVVAASILCVIVEPWCLIFITIGTMLGVLYNLELLGGLLHHELGGMITFGISWCFIPVFCMSCLMGDFTISAFIFAIGWAVFCAGALLLYEASKPTLHEVIPFIDNPGEGPDIRTTKLAIFKWVITTIIGFWIIVVALALG